mmetsp:Transcript_20847/g.49450  ORF Transcript_20847/g.49450 Transcript_20847/m.49450 type:complete len:346 (+) Transcript_20847:6286-7323(+)
MDFIVDIKVIVFPLPGGPLRMKGFLSSSQAAKAAVCRTVSTVEMIRLESATFSGSTSKVGTRLSQWYHAPSSTRTSKSSSVVSPPRPSGAAISPKCPASNSQNFMRVLRNMSPPKDQQIANTKYFCIKLRSTSSARGNSSCASSYSRIMLIPFRTMENKPVSARIMVKVMMWSMSIASFKAESTTAPLWKQGSSASMHFTFVFCSFDKPSPSSAPLSWFSLFSRFPYLMDLSSLLHTISSVTTSLANHTMPHRLTVANVAYFKVSTSNMMRTFGGIARRSPLGRVRSLLSSRTELRFSAHSGSTSPSNMIHWRRLFSPLCPERMRRRMSVKTPSVHSNVVGSNLP